MRYDSYNREERALCFHLFRLLHEKLADNVGTSALGRLLNLLSTKNLEFKNCRTITSLSQLRLTDAAIFPEVALIRDAYKNRRQNLKELKDFMDDLVAVIKEQENVQNCRLYSELPGLLCDPRETHPGQIRRKAQKLGIHLGEGESRVYVALQGMFNAKPDMAITADHCLMTFEAKFTEEFDREQLQRSSNITEVWASLLYQDLGFEKAPAYNVITIGLSKKKPDLSWEEIFGIAQEFYARTDRSFIAFANAINRSDSENNPLSESDAHSS